MSILFVYSEDRPEAPEATITDGNAISGAVAGLGASFTRWRADRELAPGASQADIIAAYATEIERLKARGGYQAVDVVRLEKGTPNTAPMRQKFLSEHRHSEDEVRFFVEGSGTFYLHIEGKVYTLLCEQNDLIAVPANTRHWFDMGTDPGFCAVRLFTNPDGWVGHFTGDPIASRFITHDDVLLRAAAA